LLGPDIDAAAAEEICDLHRITFHRHGHESYLNRQFFRTLPAALGENFMVKRARLDGETIAAAVFYWHAEALYGRYWGAREHHDGLHFELCYHQGIDFCIERGITRFEPGTGGDHKISRGFVPAQTCSMHWIVDARFRGAIADYLRREGVQVEGYSDEVSRHVPYRDLRRSARSK
jgi:predicted N-acyltransferase